MLLVVRRLSWLGLSSHLLPPQNIPVDIKVRVRPQKASTLATGEQPEWMKPLATLVSKERKVCTRYSLLLVLLINSRIGEVGLIFFSPSNTFITTKRESYYHAGTPLVNWQPLTCSTLFPRIGILDITS